ncbi:hypothetical protein H4R23_006165, partial [Coemansia sp. Cherry 401B]
MIDPAKLIDKAKQANRKDPWAKREAWRSHPSFSKLAQLRGMFPGFGIASGLFAVRILPTSASVPACASRLAIGGNVYRALQTSATLHNIVPYKLADIGEGITECEIIQWFVKPGDKVSQFDKICEVASDKATVEITSRYDGIIKKLYYQDSDIALVGKPIVDIEIEGPSAPDTLAEEPALSSQVSSTPAELPGSVSKNHAADRTGDVVYATPAVRRVARENA